MIVVGIDNSNDRRDAVKAGTLQATVMLQAQAIAAQGVPIWITTCKRREAGGSSA
ncbi:hypothetical protein MJ575_08550 [Klebsiella pneumoniae]|nr:hypothetical protein MJ575_08550 [Klebsiella pneumoniae]